MKITFVTPTPSIGGGQRVIATYAERLSLRGHEVTVVALPHPPSPWKAVLKSWLRGRPRPRHSPASHYGSSPVRIKLLDRPRPVVASDLPDADVVIATWWETAEWVAEFPPSKGTKGYFIQHYEAFEYIDHARVDATWRLPMQKIVVARWLADLSKNRFGDESAIVIPNAVDHGLFHAPPRAKNARPAVGVMYSHARFKGCDIALQAFRIAREQVLELTLHSFGDPPTTGLPLPGDARNRVRPRQEELRTVYALCDAWLFGSRSEGFGLPILEAMACRTPVIGTPAGAAPELIAQGGGMLVKPEDPRDMADAIVKVCRMSNEQWQTLSDAAFATAGRYSWDDATDLFERALLDTMASGRSRESSES